MASKLMVFSLFDRKIREYGPPLVAANAPAMYRELRRNVQPGSMLEKYPEDFDLYHLADMDSETGKVTAAESQQLVDNLAVVLQETRNGAGS